MRSEKPRRRGVQQLRLTVDAQYCGIGENRSLTPKLCTKMPRSTQTYAVELVVREGLEPPTSVL